MATLDQLAPDLWVATRPLPIAVGDLGARMTVIRTAGDTLMLHSPVALDEALKSALDALGTVRWVIAPNKAHHLFVAPYVTAYPSAVLCAAPGLAEKRADLVVQHVLGEPRPADWPHEVDYHVVAGASLLNEAAFLHRPSQTLILTDLAFNVRAGDENRARFFHWIVGAEGRFGPHRLIRLSMRDRAATRRSIEYVLAWNFDRVIVSHGAVLATGGPAAMRQAFAFLPA